MKIKWPLLLLSIAAVIITAGIGSLFTDTGSWYQSVKPAITPPNIVFPIVWTTLFILIAISLYFALSSSKQKLRTRIFSVYCINFILNILWSLFFFTLKSPIVAFIDLVLLWLSILFLLLIAWKKSKIAYYTLLPYIAWVSFAGILNVLVILA